MIRINLLPYRDERRQRQILHYIGVAALAIVVVAGLILSTYSYGSMQLGDAQQRLQALQDRNSVIRNKIGELSKFKEVQAEVEKKLDLVTELQQGRFQSLSTLLELSSAIPKNVWLTQVRTSSGRVDLSGLGESNRAVAKFMRSLEDKKAFAGVNLKLIKRQRVNGVPLRSFSLTMKRVIVPEDRKVADKQKNAVGNKAT